MPRCVNSVFVSVCIVDEYNLETLSQTAMKSHQPVSNQLPEVTFSWHDSNRRHFAKHPRIVNVKQSFHARLTGLRASEIEGLSHVKLLVGWFSSLNVDSSPPL